MKKRWFSIILLFLLFSLTVGSVSAQDYLFMVEREEVNLYVNEDGSASIEYTLDFVNLPGSHAIDFVDIGLPNDNYDQSSIDAKINGIPILHIQPSEYVSPGIELGLGGDAIPSDQTGQVHVMIGTVRDILYNSDIEDYASIEFSPSWFGEQYCFGDTDLTFTIFLPAGMNSEEPRYHEPQNWVGSTDPNESGFDESGRVYYRWQSSEANGYTQYIFGSSFPAHLIPAASIVTPPAFNLNFDKIFDVLGDSCCPIGFFLMFFGIPVVSGIWGNKQQKKRKLKYLPPKIKIEGHGIKRGLTAVQAAVLIEQPADKLMTMILFSCVKKGACTVTKREPLAIEVSDPLSENLHQYEIEFLEAFKKTKKADQRRALQTMMVNLVKSTSKIMKGFSLKETLAYYESIMQRAWKQVETSDTPEVQMSKFDEAMEWTMLDDDYEDRTRDIFSTRPVFVPMWWGRYDPTFRPTARTGGIGTGSIGSGNLGGSGQTSLPNLPGSAFAASVVSGVQGFSSGVIGDLTSFTSGITNKTNPVPKSTSRSSGRSSGGGGSSCACACACAGCACACAGGGR